MKRQHLPLDFSASEQKAASKRQAVRASTMSRAAHGKPADGDATIPFEFNPAEKGKRNRFWMGVALLLAIAAGLYVLFSPGFLSAPETKIAISEVPLVEAVAVAEPDSSSITPAVLESALADGENARAIISDLRREDKKADLSAMFDQAEEFRTNGNPADAYLLHLYLAKKAYGRSAMVLGVTSDPVYYTRSGALGTKPDPFQAYKWYSHAVRVGVPEAQKNLDNLKENIEAVALSGDRQAQRLLLQWQ